MTIDIDKVRSMTSSELCAGAFIKGASSVFVAHGMDPDASLRSSLALCKSAASRGDGEEDETWFHRNKWWLIPTLIGTAAFQIGGDAGRYGRPDKNYFQNAGSAMLKRLGSVFGSPMNAWTTYNRKTPEDQFVTSATPDIS